MTADVPRVIEFAAPLVEDATHSHTFYFESASVWRRAAAVLELDTVTPRVTHGQDPLPAGAFYHLCDILMPFHTFINTIATNRFTNLNRLVRLVTRGASKPNR